MNTDIDRYAVFGNPVAHSKSPQIHHLFARQTEQPIDYTAQYVDIGEFDRTARVFFANQGRGMNVTVPFKRDAWKFADTHSKRARLAGAVNTLSLQGDGSVSGDTTDGIGLVRDLVQNHRIALKEKTILIIGAGGAVRGVLEAILEQQPCSLLIANRTRHKAITLANDFSSLNNIATDRIRGCDLSELDHLSFDIVINGTSASLHGELPPLPDSLFNPLACSYDMMYSATPTLFMQWSAQHGATDIFDGLGMLVEQAAESFFIWRNVRPQTAPVIKIIRESLIHQ